MINRFTTKAPSVYCAYYSTDHLIISETIFFIAICEFVFFPVHLWELYLLTLLRSESGPCPNCGLVSLLADVWEEKHVWDAAVSVC